MGNSIKSRKAPSDQVFKFKQFEIHQGQCAMKVGTLSCILGAYAFHPNPKCMLDIGTGTGILALMLAQRYHFAAIDAVEIDDPAYQQASENIAASPWSYGITAHHCDIERFHPKTSQSYDLIITNPPFFENHLPSPDPRVNLARHDEGMTAPKLLREVSRLLDPSGYFFILLPEVQMERFTALAGVHRFFPFSELRIYNYRNDKVKALIRAFAYGQSALKSEELIVYSGINRYSEQFVRMQKAYYLHF